ncbi:Scr1 family TA system antitoxin-like transcriptional regulator [Streptomyces sp. NPDC004311]|uniref:Scr1 family TA system antitoxin-like transcriptional regulator n=1 Tax=Streptomyces sp. NPDC004311 TaxID=3364698 RepID=UPI0036968058
MGRFTGRRSSTSIVPTWCPASFKLPGYATALLASIAQFRGTPGDVSDAVKARTDRSHVIREGGHRFTVLIEEAVLRYQIGGAEVMAAQLGHLLSVMAIPPGSLGVIPFTALGDVHHFRWSTRSRGNPFGGYQRNSVE